MKTRTRSDLNSQTVGLAFTKVVAEHEWSVAVVGVVVVVVVVGFPGRCCRFGKAINIPRDSANAANAATRRRIVDNNIRSVRTLPTTKKDE